MSVVLRILSVLLLLFNGVGAFYGGFKFITDPTGASLGMNLSLLQNSPFTNYLVPGIILLTANGIMSFVVIALILFKVKFYPFAIIAEGCILFGWISIQVIMLQVIAGLHVGLWTVSVLLILIGIALNRSFQT